MTSVEEAILELFGGSQETTACHQKNSLLMRKMYRKVDFQQFWLALLRPIYGILEMDFKQKNPYVDRMIEFVGLFCSTLKNPETNEDSFTEEPIISALFEYLLQATQSNSDIIRFRACQLINKILDHLVGGEISDDLYELMQDVLTERLSDSKGVIRLQAIEALYRLQDPTDPEDSLISEFIQLMHDTQAKVRKLCVEKIACRQDVIQHLVQRTRDIDANVRLAAFKRLTKFANFLKITDRRSLLFTALFGQITKVKDYVFTEFLTSWLEIYDNNIVSLMKSLRLDADEEDIDSTSELYGHILNKFYFKTRNVKELIAILPLNDENLLPYEQLNWETVTYWRHLVALLAKNVDSEFEQNVSPEIVFLCRYIKGYSEFSAACTDESYLEKQYIIKQLFHIIRNCDMADPHSVKSIHALVDYIVKKEDLMDDTVEIIIGTLEHTIRDAETRCRFGMEIVSDILSPVNAEEELRKEQDRQFQLSKLKVQLDVLQADQEEALAKADYMEAQRLKLLIEDVLFRMNDLKNAIYSPLQDEPKKKTDVPTVCKCLDIVWAILRCANIPNLTPTLKSMKTDFLPELLVHNNEIIRLKALRCYAICCIMDKPTAQQGIHIFAVPISAYQAGEECDTQTLKMCISAISDLLRIYGADLMAEPSEDQLSESVDEEHQKIFAGGTSLTSLVQGLVDLMDDEQLDIQLKACEGLCKLVLDERIYSAPLISRLTLKWCQPADEDEPQSENLKQFIGHVLEKLSSLPDSSEQMEDAVLLTINTLVNAPKNSPLADVDVDNIAKFMLALCKVSPKGKTMHCNIALALSRNINRNPDKKINSVYSKMLLMLDLPEDQSVIEEIFAILDEAREYVDDKTASKNITKLMSTLSEMLRGDKDMSVIAEEPESPQLTEEGEEEENVVNIEE